MSAGRSLLRHTGVLAALGYAVVGIAVLAPSLRPGHTIVPSDIVTAVQPYNHLAGGIRDQNPAVSDAALQFFPWVRFFTTAMHNGHFPQWNPQVLGGVRVAPNGFFGPYYPVTWLSRWLSAYDFYNVFVLIHLILGALGVYAFARVLGARRISSWMAGLLVFAVAFWVHWSLHLGHFVGMVWAPWALAAAHLVARRPTLFRVAALAGVFGLWWLGGNPQYAYFGSLAMAAYAGAVVLRGRLLEGRPLVRPALALAAGVGLGALLAAPALLPSAAMTTLILRAREPQSALVDSHLRGADAIRLVVNEARGNPPDHVLRPVDGEALMDSPFIGVTALLLAGAGVAGRGRFKWLLAAGAVGALALAFTGLPHELLYHLPGYDRFRVSARWLSVFPVFALPLAALGIDALLDRRRAALAAAAVTGALCVAGLAVWWLHQRATPGAPHGYFSHRALFTVVVLVAASIAAAVAFRSPRVAVAGLVLCIGAEVFFHTPRWYPDLEQRTSYPPVSATTTALARGGRLVHAGNGPPSQLMPVAPNIPMAYGVSDVQGAAVFFPKAVDRYLRLIDDYGGFADAQNVAPEIHVAAVGSRLLDAIDARTVVSSAELPGSTSVAGEPPADFVYARASAGPALLVPRANPADDREMWSRVADPTWDPRQTAAVRGLGHAVAGGTGTVRRTAQTSDSDAWSVDAPEGGFLRVAGAWDKGWRATIDGARAPVLLADGIFRGVVVPAGDHAVRFTYRNPDAERGVRVAALALVALFAVVLTAVASVRRRAPAASRDGRGAPAPVARTEP